MTVVIKSGDNGNTAKVSVDGKLKTSAVSQSSSIDSAIKGDTFFIGPGIVELTDDGLSELLYVKNDDFLDWIIDTIDSTFGQSTGAAGKDFTTTFTINPTGGTLITAGTPSAGLQTNLGSAKPLAATIMVGAQGSTITGGTAVEEIVPNDSFQQIFRAGPIVITPGSSFSIGVTPAVGNTSIKTDISVILYRMES